MFAHLALREDELDAAQRLHLRLYCRPPERRVGQRSQHVAAVPAVRRQGREPRSQRRGLASYQLDRRGR